MTVTDARIWKQTLEINKILRHPKMNQQPPFLFLSILLFRKPPETSNFRIDLGEPWFPPPVIVFKDNWSKQAPQQERALLAFTYGHLLALLPAQARPSRGISSTFSRQVHCFQRKLSCRSHRCICTASCGGEMLNTCDTCGLHVSGGVLEALLGFPPSDPQYLL